jgi:signal transduction histidine kinase/ligand-binding sensor domain-containing protein
VKGSQLECYGDEDDLSFKADGAEALADDGTGGVWIGTVHGVCHWKRGTVTTYFPKILQLAQGAAGVLALEVEPDGSLLVGIGKSGEGLGLQRMVGGVWKDYEQPTLRASGLTVNTMLKDHDGGLWVATRTDGIYHVHADTTDRFAQTDGLAGDSVQSFFEDREGSIWALSAQGIDIFRDLPVATIGKREGLSGDRALAVFASPGGTVWTGNDSVVDYLRNSKFGTIVKKDLPGQRITSLLEDHAGRLWLGFDNELAVRDHGRFRSVRTADSRPLGTVIAIAEDVHRDIWAVATGSPQRLFRISDFKVVDDVALPDPMSGAALVADKTEGVWLGFRTGSLGVVHSGRVTIVSTAGNSGSFRNLFSDSDGSIWGATTLGLVHWKDGKRIVFSTRNGLPCDNIHSVIKDDSGSLWLYSACGVLVISPAELEKQSAQPNAAITARVFDVFDGARPGESPFGPVVSKASDGRLWFANGRVLQYVDPGRLPVNHVAPPVRIEQVVADRKTYTPVENLHIPALTRNVQIDYTALSFAVPQKVRFRYKLEGRDEDWQDPGTRRQAFYNDLSPSKYRFRVIACNNSGIWNQEGAVWNFSVAPAWYQTAWFRFLCGFAGLLGLVALYQIRVRQIATAMNAGFDERLAERTRLAGELHDTILQTVQATKMIADNARYDHAADPIRLREAVESISDWLAQATTEGRTALNALRLSTTERNDLGESFQRAAVATGLIAAMRFVLSTEGAPKELHPIVRDEIYRIGCEAIRNAGLHSGATELMVTLSYAQNFTVLVRDNGRGMDPETAESGRPGHFGLSGMQERTTRIHGKLRIMSRANAGTDIELTIPGKMAFRESGTNQRHWLSRLQSFFERYLRRRRDP